MQDDQTIQIDRRKLEIRQNSLVSHAGQDYQITNVLNEREVVAQNLITNRPARLSIEELKPATSTVGQLSVLSKEDSEISDEHWLIAVERYRIIKPIIEHSTKAQVEEIAEKEGQHFTTIYKWLKSYRDARSILALVPQKRGWKEAKSRLPQKTEEVIQKAISNLYLTVQKPTAAKVINYINSECYQLGIDPPHPNSIRLRINGISQFRRLKGQGERKKLRDKYLPAIKEFPNADYPLAVVQIDHTPLDIEVVDEKYRESIGKPYLTLAIDVFSRMVVGYYLSLDAPSTTSVGMCLACSILPKNKLLMRLNLGSTWDVWGLMDTVHSDNGSDFRVSDFKKSCLKYGINWEYRPIGGAKFGGHIERLIGVVNEEAHTLPGSTFSNIFKKGSYDSSKNSAMTIAELEEYIVKWITEIYHQKKHSGIQMSPIKKWEEGVWGDKLTMGRGLPSKVSDADTLILDFLPEWERTIQRTGISIEGLKYYADCLRAWIGATVSNDSDVKRKFTFKRDPRDITVIWFFDPDLKQYFKVPTALKKIPPMSAWEYERVKEHRQKQGSDKDDQEGIYKAIIELRQMVEDKKSKTRKARRDNQRRTEHEKHASTHIKGSSTNVTSMTSIKEVGDIWDEPLTPFDDDR